MASPETCRKGHPWSEENTRIVTIRGCEVKQCRQCDKEAAQDRRDKARGDRPKGRVYVRKETCIRGHAMEGDNVYWYETKTDGRQRRCKACQEERRQGYIAEGVTVQPTKERCANGHALEGENLFYGPTGHAHCRKCALIATQRWQQKNRDEYLNSRRGRRRTESKSVYEVMKILTIEIFNMDLPEDEEIDRLRELYRQHLERVESTPQPYSSAHLLH